MRVLGIDPGTVVMGYGIIDSNDGELVIIDCGVIKPPSGLGPSERLGYLYGRLIEVITRFKPDGVVVEEPFVAENVRSALAIGKAQAVAILAAVNSKIPVSGYSPARIKQQVAGYGTATKEQIQKMVKLQLNLPELPQPEDASDALAAAICHFRESHLKRLLSRQDKGD